MADPIPRQLVIASSNQGKLGEYRNLLAAAGFELIPFASEVDETGASYAENAILKAEAALAATGLPSLGDDTGIEVDALGGAPGLRSARLAPTQAERTAHLLRLLGGHQRPWTGRFVCSIALAAPGFPTRTVDGECRGEVVPQWQGTVGFGYDPIFMVPAAGKTFGQMDPSQKNRYSHRGAAVLALVASGWLESLR